MWIYRAGAEPAGIEDVPVVGEPTGHREPSPPPGAGQLFQRGHFGGRVHVANARAAERTTVLPAHHAILGVPPPAGRAVQRHVQQHRQSPAQGQATRFRFRRLSARGFAGFAAAGAGQRRQPFVVVVVVPATVRRRTGRGRRRRWRRKFRQRRHPDAGLT